MVIYFIVVVRKAILRVPVVRPNVSQLSTVVQ